MKLSERMVRAFLTNPPDDIRAVLFHGPNRGLARERAITLISTLVPDLSDPFRLAIPNRHDLKAKPSLLADEAAMITPYGQRRVIWLKEYTDEDEPSLSCLLATDNIAGIVVLEAGEITARSKLRRLAEPHKAVAVIGCYPENSRSTEQLIHHYLHDHGLIITQEALNDLITRLAGDRALVRSELNKLILYCADSKRVDCADIEAVISDSSETEWEELAYISLSGKAEASQIALGKLLAKGAQPISGLRALARHIDRLRRIIIAVQAGQSIDNALVTLRPPIFFKIHPIVRSAVQAWLGQGPQALETIFMKIYEAEKSIKLNLPANIVISRFLLTLAELSRPEQP